MKKNNVYYLDDYRYTAPQMSKNLQKIIESHLAEAERFRPAKDSDWHLLNGNLKFVAHHSSMNGSDLGNK